MCEHGTKPTVVFLSADEKPLGCHFQVGHFIILQHSVTKKHLFLYPKGDRSGWRKPKKNKQH